MPIYRTEHIGGLPVCTKCDHPSHMIGNTMKHTFAVVVCSYLVITSMGCTMCFTPYDDHYNAFGGIIERQDPNHGRAGSILSDPTLSYAESGDLTHEAAEADLYPPDGQQPGLEAIAPPLPQPPTEQDENPEAG